MVAIKTIVVQILARVVLSQIRVQWLKTDRPLLDIHFLSKSVILNLLVPTCVFKEFFVLNRHILQYLFGRDLVVELSVFFGTCAPVIENASASCPI